MVEANSNYNNQANTINTAQTQNTMKFPLEQKLLTIITTHTTDPKILPIKLWTAASNVQNCMSLKFGILVPIAQMSRISNPKMGRSHQQIPSNTAENSLKETSKLCPEAIKTFKLFTLSSSVISVFFVSQCNTF